MDYLQSFAISAAGMSVERTRVEVSALNLANANTVLEAGAGYRPLQVVARAGVAETASFDALVRQGLTGPVVDVLPLDRQPRRVLDPGHPMADASGYVAYPAIDVTAEMVGVMAATRAYEANVSAMNAARTIALKTLDIGSAT